MRKLCISWDAEKFALREHLVFWALVLHVTSRETNLDFSEKPEWKRWKINIKDVWENSSSAVTLFFQCSVLTCININDSFWMETCFAKNSRLRRKCLWNQPVVSRLFLVHSAANLHMCACLLSSLLNQNSLFSSVKLHVNNLWNQNINHWKENWQREKKWTFNWLHNKSKTWHACILW